MDLKFPHHENEIAQSCAACGTPFVHLWMHNGFVRIDDEKMSKSLGNFFTVRDVLKTLRDPEVLRFFLLSSHYRGPINYSAAQLAQADETLLGLYRALKGTGMSHGPGSPGSFQSAFADFHAAMEDDFNTPEAFAVMQGVARELNSAKAAGELEKAERGRRGAAHDGRNARPAAAGSRPVSQTRHRCGELERTRDRGIAGGAPQGASREEFRRIRSDPSD